MWTPLQQFKCDKCGSIIQSPREGVLEWTDDKDPISGYPVAKDFRIVHHNAYSPLRAQNGRGCTIHFSSSPYLDASLDELLNSASGTAYLLGMLDAGPMHNPNAINQVQDVREFVELMRRLLIPYYEEARQYWSQATADGLFDGDSESAVYGETRLLEIINRYA